MPSPAASDIIAAGLFWSAADAAERAADYYGASRAFSDAARFYAKLDLPDQAAFMLASAHRTMDRHTAGMPILDHTVLATIHVEAV